MSPCGLDDCAPASPLIFAWANCEPGACGLFIQRIRPLKVSELGGERFRFERVWCGTFQRTNVLTAEGSHVAKD